MESKMIESKDLNHGMKGRKQEEKEEEEEEEEEKEEEKEEEEEAWPPRFTKCLWTFEDGTELAYADSRRLGRLSLVEDPFKFPAIEKLGFDPLISMPSLEEFSELLGRKTQAIKAVLLDQTFSAGVGNYLADEILYQSKVHPERKVKSLSKLEVQKIWEFLPKIISEAASCHKKGILFPNFWLFHFRWTNRKSSEDLNGSKIEFRTVGGRTSAFVPRVQTTKGYSNQEEFDLLSKESKKCEAKPTKRKASAPPAEEEKQRPSKLKKAKTH